MNKHLVPIIMVPLMALAFLGAYALLWFGGTRSLAASADQWATNLRFDGWTVEADTPKPSGFPLSMGVRYDTLTLTPPKSLGTWSLQLTAVDLSAPLWNSDNPTLSGDSSPHTLTVRGDSGGAADYLVAAEALQVRLSTDTQKTADGLFVDIKGLTVKPVSTGRKAIEPVIALTAFQFTAVRQAEADTAETGPAWTVSFHLDTMGLADRVAGPFGREVKEVSGRLQVLKLLPMATTLRERLARWKDNDGSLVVENLRVTWLPFALTASGAAGLGEGLQPTASLTTHMRGLMETVEAAESIGVVRTRDASMARVVLPRMARQVGGGPLHSVTLQVLNRVVAVGPVALFEVPRVNWGVRTSGREETLGEQIRPGFEIDQQGNIVRKP